MSSNWLNYVWEGSKHASRAAQALLNVALEPRRLSHSQASQRPLCFSNGKKPWRVHDVPHTLQGQDALSASTVSHTINYSLCKGTLQTRK